jgi:broad specificity phosphatase PhoE
MATAFFVTHPEVSVDPDRPVTAWRLSDRGIGRMRTFAASPVLSNVRSIWSSTEAKAIEAAGILAAGLGLPVQVDAQLGENDRSATGFLPSAEFERVADDFFANPRLSVRGWQRAIDAQERIVRAVQRILASHCDGDIAFIAHGGVGTLLLCKLLGAPISRRRDQPFQGHYFAFDVPACDVIHAWRPIAQPS